MDRQTQRAGDPLVENITQTKEREMIHLIMAVLGIVMIGAGIVFCFFAKNRGAK